MGTALKTRPQEEHSSSAPLSSNLGWLLAQASHVLITEMTVAFAELGVSPRGHCVLSTASTGDFTQRELAEAVGLDKTTMVVTIDELERAGLAERRLSAEDRRARIIAVTKAGEKCVATGQRVVEQIQEDVLASLPEDEREAFMSTLSTLVCSRLSTPAACRRAPRRRS
jgi:MarR family transcriptional regulator, transcriptional regulator for hemolysin